MTAIPRATIAWAQGRLGEVADGILGPDTHAALLDWGYENEAPLPEFWVEMPPERLLACYLQVEARAAGQDPGPVDGWYGPRTAAALAGMGGPVPWRGAAEPMAPWAMGDAAARLGCEEAALRAVWQVECGGRPFQADGSLTRRFEPHHMPGAASSWRDSLAIGPAERERQFLAAHARDPEAALRATSWGGPQIMGFNARAAGFATATAMVEAMAAGEGAHLDAFVGFVRSQGLTAVLRARDWRQFARRYNGSGQVDIYAGRMHDVYRGLAAGV
ncbi:N-acetylmuramidase domain-containing protein [Mangrovicoccus algicola]|uniref:DUF3380 domain-containing protein n=1 Tax=Mangrovicoccus algicola TaxID=2771008 RepID=A0A8J7CUG2_9RHOB|nr:N-acetylmuramidase domain-containing protein [Mangrovicoccus algicola]MBE3637454.1 DUF3380 domain-containing protein [Mangrovicoccus algicola]